MTKKTAAIDPQIYEETAAELGRQIKVLTVRRAQIVEERAAVYGAAGTRLDAAPMDSDEIAARAHARSLLAGEAPESLAEAPAISHDRILLREQRGIDIALKILNSKNLAAIAACAVAWAEQHDGEWRQLARQITLAAVRLRALDRRAQQLLAQCVDIFAVRLPMANLFGGAPVFEWPLNDLVEECTKAALVEGIVNLGDIRRVERGESNE